MTVMDVPFWDYGQGKLRQTAGTVVRFATDPGIDVVRERFARAVEWCPTLRQRVAPSPGGLLRPRFVADADFDLEWHVRETPVAEPRDEAALWRTVTDLYRMPFDLSHSAWEAHHLVLADGSAAVWYRSMHFQIDGISCTNMLRVLSDECEELEAVRERMARHAHHAERHAGEAPTGDDGLARRLVAPVRKVVESVGHATPSIWPTRDISWRRTIVGASLDMATVKDVRRRAGTTVTAVFQAVVSSAVESVLDRSDLAGDLPDELTVSLPMSTRHLFPERYPLEMSSRQVSSPFVWPLREKDPARRLALLGEQIGDLKVERDSFVRTVELARYAPHKLIYLATRRKILASNLIASAAPGPRRLRHVDGHRVTGQYLVTAIVPNNPLALVGCGYVDRFDIGITADPTLVPRALDLPKALEAALVELDQSV
ncbi:MAG: wax ester/triacylglycerol synthase family O-acyltransferase [Acidimicrobiia bacterium]